MLIRALSMTSDLLPVAGAQVALSVLDAGGFTVAATTAISDAFGMVSWSVPTSPEPVLGSWTVSASSSAPGGNASASRGFELARYSLPTFSVSVTPSQPYLLSGRDRSAGGSVLVAGALSATHTSGAPVVGSVVLSVLQPQRSYYGMLLDGDAAMGAAGMGVASSFGAAPASPLISLGASSSDTSPDASSHTAWLLGTLALSTAADGSAAFIVAVPAGSVQWGGAPLLLRATVTEAATGESQNGTARLPSAAAPLTATLSTASTFKPGLPWSVALTLTRPDGTPATLADAPAAALTATATRRSGDSALQQTSPAVPDALGRASSSFTVPADDPACCLRGSAVDASTSCCVDDVSVSLSGVAGVAAYSYASVAFSASGASGRYLSIGQLSPAGALPLGATVSFTPSATDPGAAVRWALMGPEGAASSGSATPGVALSLVVPPSAGASPSLLAWYVFNGSVVLDTAKLSVAPSLAQTLSASFGAAAAQPGDDVQVAATGGPSCRVFIAAVDTSMSLLGADAALNATGLVDAAAAAAATALSAAQAASGGAENQPYCWLPPPQQAAGVALLTSLIVPQCFFSPSMYIPMMMDGAAGGVVMASASGHTLSPATSAASTSSGAVNAEPRVRSSFPETWLWTTADADVNGAASTTASVPDTLTSWQLSAFSVHPTMGVAVAPPPRALVVSQPFYITVAAPPTLIRGERMLLRVGLFSNLSAPTTATVTLVNASASGFEVDGGATATASLGAGESSAGVSFGVTPRALGSLTLLLRADATGVGGVSGSDALQAPLLVVPEGVPAEVTANALLRVGPGATAADSASALLSAQPPADAVAGSARATLSVVGDMMGMTLAGLGQLLTVPSGCGEQNMIGMAPNVAVLTYLASTPAAAPPPALVAAATSNAAVGFQRELTYRHADGSFSAFGDSDASGSTWLTAFVLQVFSAASSFVAVDGAVLASAAAWLASHQNAKSGAFASVGNVVHTDMVGGTSSNVSLTAFVLASLLQAPPTAKAAPAGLQAAAAFLAANPAAVGDAYALQLRAYALALACAAPGASFCAQAAVAAAAVAATAVSPAGGLRHWESPVAASATPMYPWQAPSADIELTGYAVLTLVMSGRVADAVEPARWLVAQRSSGGGFASTQDTVVGLAALARFAAATYSSPPQLSLAVSAPGLAAGASVAVTPATASLLQQMDVPVGEPVSLSAVGSGTVLAQLTTRYNVASGGGSGAAGFTLNLSAVNVSGGAPGRRRLLQEDAPAALLHQTVCASRLPGAPAARQSGMVVLEAGLFSGYTPIAASLAAVQAAAPGLVKRIDVDSPGRRVLFYLESLPSGGGAPVCLSFDSLATADVSGHAPACSRVYSYYAPGDTGTAALPASAVGAAATRPQSGVTGPASLLATGDAPAGEAAGAPSDVSRGGAKLWAAAVAAGAAALLAALC